MKVDYSNCFIELYAGCGGHTLGMITSGLKCIAAVEYNEDACATFWTNLCMDGFSNLKVENQDKADKLMKILGTPEEKYLGFKNENLRQSSYQGTSNQLFTHIPDDDWLQQTEDISPVLNLYCFSTLELEPEDIMNDLGFNPGEIGMITGGPPCQGFSTSNTNRHESDVRNQHPFRFLHYVDKIKPKVFEIENVTGMLTLGKKKGESEGPFPKWIKQRGDEIGYVVEYQIINMKNYGVPQSRRRVFYQGIRKDLYDQGTRHIWPPVTHNWSLFDKTKTISFEKFQELYASGIEPYVTVSEAIGSLSRWKLSASRDQDCKHLPDGHPDRYSNGLHDETTQIRNDGFIYYKDRFSGNWFKGNHQSEYGSFNQEVMVQCINCQNFNYTIRKRCHSCKAEFPTLNQSNLKWFYEIIVDINNKIK